MFFANIQKDIYKHKQAIKNKLTLDNMETRRQDIEIRRQRKKRKKRRLNSKHRFIPVILRRKIIAKTDKATSLNTRNENTSLCKHILN